MTTTTKDPVVVVLQMTGANDYLNTVIPYTNGHYHDARPKVGIPADKVIPINDELGFNPQMGRIKQLWDEGKVAIIHGIGYENSPRSHFRSMDIWHTCEPDIVGTEGWAGRVIRDLDPRGENVLKGVNFGQGLPRALALRGTPITSVSSLESYGVLSSVPVEAERDQLLDRFARMYSPTVGTGAVMDYLGQTGRDALKGADIIRSAPEQYSSTVEYADTPIAKYLRDIAQVYLADLGTQLFYTQHGSFDSHFNQPPMHTKLWTDMSSCHRRLLRRPGRTRRRRQPHHGALHRVRTSRQGQRHRNRPRRGRRGLRDRQPGQGRPLQRVSLPAARGSDPGRP